MKIKHVFLSIIMAVNGCAFARQEGELAYDHLEAMVSQDAQEAIAVFDAVFEQELKSLDSIEPMSFELIQACITALDNPDAIKKVANVAHQKLTFRQRGCMVDFLQSIRILQAMTEQELKILMFIQDTPEMLHILEEAFRNDHGEVWGDLAFPFKEANKVTLNNKVPSSAKQVLCKYEYSLLVVYIVSNVMSNEQNSLSRHLNLVREYAKGIIGLIQNNYAGIDMETRQRLDSDLKRLSTIIDELLANINPIA